MTAIIPIRWVRLPKWCEATGVSPNSVHKWRQKGEWVDGVQCRIGRDGKLWVNLEKADEWVEGSRSVPTRAGARQSA